MSKPSFTCVTGPLGPHRAGFEAELARMGYSPWTVSAHLYRMAALSCWLERRKVGLSELDSAAVLVFLADPGASWQAARITSRGMVPLLTYLRARGLMPVQVRSYDGPMGWLVAEFVSHLVGERALAPQTIRGYENTAVRFLAGCGLDQAVAGECRLVTLTGRLIRDFVLAESARLSAGSANNVGSGLRALMVFLYLRGYTDRSLADAVPRGVVWRDTGRSRALPAADALLLLSSCDRDTACGRRNFAILTLLWRLGLRAGEVASLRLEDLDWRAGELVLRGKGNRLDRLPLPVDVGEVLADYCQRSRVSRGDRHVFLKTRAPYDRLTSSAVTLVVTHACEVAGLPRSGAHCLRHGTATAMRAAGAPLLEVGQVLRHGRMVTTAFYAKDDLTALTTIARAWPGVQA